MSTEELIDAVVVKDVPEVLVPEVQDPAVVTEQPLHNPRTRAYARSAGGESKKTDCWCIYSDDDTDLFDHKDCDNCCLDVCCYDDTNEMPGCASECITSVCHILCHSLSCICDSICDGDD